MWKVTDFECRTAMLDFRSAGLWQREVTQLFSGAVRLANAIELTDWSEESVQVVVCERCGTIHCEPGGWVSVRRAGGYVVLAPSRRLMDARDEHEAHDSRPPDYVTRLGWPFVPITIYGALQTKVPALPTVDELRPLAQDEAVAMLQWEAPARALGRLPARTSIRPGFLVAVTEGDLETEIGRLRMLLDTWRAGRGPVRLEPCNQGDGPVEFHLDARGTSSWRPMIMRDAEAHLSLEPGLVALEDEPHEGHAQPRGADR